jgi:hypothetical protein
MDWRVELSGDNSDLAELSKSFNSDNLKICKDGDNYVLSSSEFNEITEADIVLDKSKKLVSCINGGANIANKFTRPIQVGGVESIDDKGKRNQYIFPKSIALKINFGRPTILVSGKETSKYLYDDLENWVSLANRYENVAVILNYLEIGSDEMVTLYKVYEIICKDVGGEKIIRENGWASRGKIELFTRTANSPDAIGDKARHGIQKNQPPQNPMTLNEAKALIQHLVKCWLDSKITH